MKLLHIILSGVSVLATTHLMYGQVGIGTTSPHSSAAIEISSTSQGFLPPRMTYTQRNSIISPAAGLQVWCNNCGPNGEMQVFNGTSWTNMIGGTASPPPPPGIGDEYEGGIIFYILQSGDPGYIEGETHGLISVLEDLQPASWGCQGGSIPGTSFNLGSGQANTNLILAGCGTSGIAARICDELVYNGFSDWYLPSSDELVLLCQNQQYLGVFYQATYWSSTEHNIDNAYTVYFASCGSGFGYHELKGGGRGVRAIRSF